MRALSTGTRFGIGVGVGLGFGAAVFAGAGIASAETDAGGASVDNRAAAAAARSPVSGQRSQYPNVSPHSRHQRGPAPAAAARRTATVASAVPSPTVSVNLPPMPVSKGRSFEVSRDVIVTRANQYVAAGGDPSDNARFFFGDLAVRSLDELADPHVTRATVRSRLGNLAASGYFGGIWLRDNLRDDGTGIGVGPAVGSAAGLSSTASAFAIRFFGGLAGRLTGAAAGPDWLVNAAAHVSVPVLLALYGYNRGYLQVILDHPPAGVPSMENSLSCNAFLDCNASTFPLEVAGRYADVQGKLAQPASFGWKEMAFWTKLLEGATGAGRSVWEAIAAAGAFSPKSYAALVDLSSAYLMVSKAAVLSAMLASTEGDAAVGRSSLRLQAGLWMWSGSYFGGLASKASAETIPSISADI